MIGSYYSLFAPAIQTYLALDAQAELARQRAAVEGKDPERAYRRAMRLGFGKIALSYMIPRLMFGTTPVGLAAVGYFNWVASGGPARFLDHMRRMTSEYRAAVIPMMHSYEHTERSFQMMQQGIQAIHGYRSIIGSEAAVMASRYAR
jgi:hypothetical protein